jgi:signal transduction histidine kinase
MALKQRSASGLDLHKTNLTIEKIEQISHDFRSPLNIIIGFTELMLEEIPGKINEEQRQCLKDVLNSSRRLLNLVNEICDLTPTVINTSGTLADKHD